MKTGSRKKISKKTERLATRVASIHLLVGIALVIAKLAMGTAGGSKALMVSAMCSLLVCFSAAVMLIDSKFALYPAKDRYPYGHGKIQLLIAGAMSTLIFIGIAAIGGSMFHSWFQHRQVPADPSALWTALACTFVIMITNLLAAQAEKSIPGSAKTTYDYHTRTDAYISLVVVVSIVAGTMGFVLVDSIVAVAIAVYVIVIAGKMLARTVAGLMDVSIDPRKTARIKKAVRRVENVAQVVSIKGVQTGGMISVAITVGLPASLSMLDVEKIRRDINARIKAKEKDVSQVLVSLAAIEEDAVAQG